MANPNKTVSAFRNRKMAVIHHEVFSTKSAAEDAASAFQGKRCRISSFKLGPRSKPVVRYTLRVYG